MYKKAWCMYKVVVFLIKPIAFATFSLPSPSSLLKLPNVCGEVFEEDNITSITTYTRKFINHPGAKPLRDSIFYIKKILDFESSRDKPYTNRFTWLISKFAWFGNTSLCRDWEIPNDRDFKIELRCFLGLDSWLRLTIKWDWLTQKPLFMLKLATKKT